MKLLGSSVTDGSSDGSSDGGRDGGRGGGAGGPEYPQTLFHRKMFADLPGKESEAREKWKRKWTEKKGKCKREGGNFEMEVKKKP